MVFKARKIAVSEKKVELQVLEKAIELMGEVLKDKIEGARKEVRLDLLLCCLDNLTLKSSFNNLLMNHLPLLWKLYQ